MASEILCIKCGRKNSSADPFCSECGAALPESATSTPAGPTADIWSSTIDRVGERPVRVTPINPTTPAEGLPSTPTTPIAPVTPVTPVTPTTIAATATTTPKEELLPSPGDPQASTQRGKLLIPRTDNSERDPRSWSPIARFYKLYTRSSGLVSTQSEYLITLAYFLILQAIFFAGIYYSLVLLSSSDLNLATLLLRNVLTVSRVLDYLWVLLFSLPIYGLMSRRLHDVGVSGLLALPALLYSSFPLFTQFPSLTKWLTGWLAPLITSERVLFELVLGYPLILFIALAFLPATKYENKYTDDKDSY